jgi:phosphate:Na+ symporter
MTLTSTLCALLAGLGLFFIGVRGLSANLVPLAGRRARAAFAATLRGPFSIAFSGMAAGLLTQSSIAVSWVVLGFLRAGVLAEGPAFMAPAWSNVGAALLPLLVAINTEVAAEFVIGVVGFAIYFRLDRTDRLRHGMEAALGAAMLLFGMHIVADLVGQLRETMTQDHWLLLAQRAPWLLAVLGAGLALATQSSSVAAALSVAMVSAGLLTLPGALPMIAGANAASVLTNLSRLRVEGVSGRIVFTLQAVQKAAGTVLLAAAVVLVTLQPAAAPGFAGRFGIGAGAQIALLFMLAQLAGALVTAVGSQPIARLVRRLTRPDEAETLAQPAFLLSEALSDPPAALDLAMRELARLTARLPLLLEHVRAEPEAGAPSAKTLRLAGNGLTRAITDYLTGLLDHHPRRGEVVAALLLQSASGNAGALHEVLAEIAEAAPQAAGLPTAGRLIEALHALMSVVAEYAQTHGADDPDFVLDLLGGRERFMEELRNRLTQGSEASAEMLDALFRMTILFERVIWLARRLVAETRQANRALGI